MIVYLTYNDQPSGIYTSQVIDVVKYFRDNLKQNIRLIVFLSVRNFRGNKAILLGQLPDAIVLPMFPKLKNWRLNRFLLGMYCRRYKPEVVIGRSVIATQLALMMRKSGWVNKVIYDGRGAIAAEWEEYNVVQDKEMVNQIPRLEEEVVLQSDHRIGVSLELVNYWTERYAYRRGAETIIPCTLSGNFESLQLDKQQLQQVRLSLGFSLDDVVLCYSGAVSGWQSFALLSAFLIPVLQENSDTKVLFLSPPDVQIARLSEQFPEQIVQRHLPAAQVHAYLYAADFGLLIRDDAMTNRVASPVKFAEYLASGLKVIISSKIGDYSKFVMDHACGYLVDDMKAKDIQHAPSFEQKVQMQQLAMHYFRKECYARAYLSLVDGKHAVN